MIKIRWKSSGELELINYVWETREGLQGLISQKVCWDLTVLEGIIAVKAQYHGILRIRACKCGFPHCSTRSHTIASARVANEIGLDCRHPNSVSQGTKISTTKAMAAYRGARKTHSGSRTTLPGYYCHRFHQSKKRRRWAATAAAVAASAAAAEAA